MTKEEISYIKDKYCETGGSLKLDEFTRNMNLESRALSTAANNKRSINLNTILSEFEMDKEESS